MLKSSLLALGLIGATTTFAAQMTLKDAVSKAIKSHPSVRSAANAVESANHTLDASKAAYLPTADLRVASGQEESENASVTGNGDTHRRLTRFESSLTIRQNLYSGGRISSRVKQSKAFLNEQSFNLLSQKELVALNAIEAYLEVLKSADLVNISQENVKSHNDSLSTTSKRQEEGIARKSDVIQVKGRLALAEAQLQRELANKEATLERFYEAVGEKAKDLVTPKSIASKIPKDLRIAKNQALLNHPELKALNAAVDRAEAAISEAQASYQPEVNLELTGNENNNLSGVRGNNDSYQAMVVGNWNLFRGGADKATVASRVSDKGGAEETTLDRQGVIKRDLAVAWYARQAVLVELNYFKQHKATVENTLEAYKEQYKIGKRTLFDLLNAREELFQANARVIEASYSSQLSVYDIFARMGKVSNTVLTPPQVAVQKKSMTPSVPKESNTTIKKTMDIPVNITSPVAGDTPIDG